MKIGDSEQKYLNFAANISFFEFFQKEFRSSAVKLDTLKKEISILESKKPWTINSLADYIVEFPKSFLVFQELFQLLRFTNAQLIHFVFDIEKLNSINMDAIFEYLILNIKYDLAFRKLFLKMTSSQMVYDKFVNQIDNYDRHLLIANFKLAVTEYVAKIQNNFGILEQRIKTEEFSPDYSYYFWLNSFRCSPRAGPQHFSARKNF